MKWSESTTWCKKDNTAWKKHIICINENEGEIKHLKLCKISLYLLSSASVPPVQAQFIWRVCSTSETWSREWQHSSCPSVFTASIRPACPTQVQKKRCMRESVQHPQTDHWQSHKESGETPAVKRLDTKHLLKWLRSKIDCAYVFFKKEILSLSFFFFFQNW